VEKPKSDKCSEDMLCIDMKLVSRLRGEKVKRRILEEQERHQPPPCSHTLIPKRDRSRSLCVDTLTPLLRPGFDPKATASRELTLHNIHRRRASSAM
jgi:hypothetical protein